jgi:hypothetical protein
VNTAWIRPWYPGGGAGDHIDRDCPTLAKQTSTPVEGSGWMDPKKGVACATCVPSWNAECETCDYSLTEDENHEDDFPFTEAEARAWMLTHVCQPVTRIIPPPRPAPEGHGTPALFPLRSCT